MYSLNCSVSSFICLLMFALGLNLVNRTDIFEYAEKSTVSEDYKAFIEEFLKGEVESNGRKGKI